MLVIATNSQIWWRFELKNWTICAFSTHFYSISLRFNVLFCSKTTKKLINYFLKEDDFDKQKDVTNWYNE
jgi:hypothetical protein